MGFLRILLIIILIYYVFKWFAKYITPILLKKFISKYGMNQQDRNDHSDKKEGNVSVKKQQPPKKKFEGGEYVDFEEIKDL